jgi:hypothetical protein
MLNPAKAFTPAKVIEDPERFAGRQRELDEIADALQIEGGHMMIYGNRGIGKSSLAHQMMLMAQGHESILCRLTHRPIVPLDFVPVYLQCEDSITNVDEIIVRLLTTHDALADWIPFKVSRVSAEQGGQLGVNLKIISTKASTKTAVEEIQETITPDVRATFNNALKNVLDLKLGESGILIVIDEFDRVQDRSGLASLMKSLDPRVKIALVGVSTNVPELMVDHESVARQLTGGCIKTEPMTAMEIDDLFNRAELILDNQITFPNTTRNYIASLAKGHPFLVHMLGLNSTIAALRAGHSAVSQESAEAALNDIAVKGTAPIQEGMYKDAVAHSYTREVVLKEFALVDDEEIRTTPVYARIAQKLGMQDQNAISVYMGQLASDKYGRVLEKTRERYYRFRDSLFKAYAASRPFLLQPGNNEVDDE